MTQHRARDNLLRGVERDEARGVADPEAKIVNWPELAWRLATSRGSIRSATQ